MRRRWLLLAVILTAPSACDNVTWGGTEVHLQPPPAETEMAGRGGASAAGRDLPPVPRGPILLAGRRDGDTASLVVVGEVRGDDLVPLPSEVDAPGFIELFNRTRLAVGTQLVLFGEGSRVGRLTVGETGVADDYCAPRASVKGIVEIVPGAASARRLLALADTGAPSRPFTPYGSYANDREARTASLAIVATALPEAGAPWPPSIVDARVDVQGFQLPEAEGLSVASTFLYNDQLAVAEPGENAYALFVIGSRGDAGYESTFTWYQRAEDGKAAPRYFSHLDWDGDGGSEILLEVFGAQGRWYDGLAQRNGRWVRSFQDPCGAPGG